MHGYKNPSRWSSSSEDPRLPAETSEIHRQNRRLKMLYSRCVLPLLALYLLLDEISAAVLPRHFKNKREALWLDQDLFSRLSDQSDLSVGDAGDTIGHGDGRPSHSESSPGPALLLNQSQHKASDKRRKIAPMDSIGSFQMSNKRNREDEPDVYWRDASD